MKPKHAETRGSSPWSVPPVLAEQALVGALVAVVATVAEAIACAAAFESSAGAGETLAGMAHLCAMYLPFGVGAGLAVGLVLRLVRATPWMGPVRSRLGDRRRLFAPAPEAFASGVGLLTGAAVFLVTLVVSVGHFTTRYHDVRLAAWTLAAVALGLVLLAAVVVMAVAALVRPAARALGRVASVGVLLGLVVVASAIAVAVLLVRFDQILRAYHPLDLAWLPGAAITYLVLALGVRRVFRHGGRRLRWLDLIVVVVSVLALATSGALYGESNRVRGWVEHCTVAGQRLVRFWSSVTDRDDDGHSFAFGGGDCDDSDPDVYPGALDVPGDGVDADCFDGDGSRDLSDLGDGHYGERPEGLGRPNFLVFSVDALRPDHVGCLGYGRESTPNLDALCEQSVRFENVVAQSSRSIRSFPALWTGMYPSQIAFGDEYLYPSLLEENVTVAEVLSEAGWETSMVMGTDYFDRTGDFFQGFDTVLQDPQYKPPRERAVRQGIRQLERLADGDDPWLLWVHLFNVHLEYLWDDRESEFGDDRIGRYDTEVMLADRELRKMLDALRESGEADETIIVVLSDHGEAFGEHGSQGHSRTLYDEEIRSVLMLRIPGVEPRSIEQPVGLFDVMPTMLNLAGLPVPQPMPARSLVPLMADDPEWPADRLLFSELMPDGLFPFDQKAVIRADEKLIWWVRDGTYQLFDRSEDPGEQRDLSDERREQADEMLGMLRAWVASTNLPENRSVAVIEENRLDEPPSQMTHPREIRFPGMFTVLGWDLPRTRFGPGDRIPMTFYYRVEDRIDQDLFFYVDIEGPPGYAHVHDFHAHHYPLNGRYRTDQWRPGEILRDPVEMVVPHDIRRPVDMKITLRVLDEDRQPVPFVVDGRRETLLHLEDLEIR